MATKAMISAPFLALALLLAANNVVGAARKGVGIYVLRRGDFTLQFTNYGATMLSVVLPDKHGIRPPAQHKTSPLLPHPWRSCSYACSLDLSNGVDTILQH